MLLSPLLIPWVSAGQPVLQWPSPSSHCLPSAYHRCLSQGKGEGLAVEELDKRELSPHALELLTHSEKAKDSHNETERKQGKGICVGSVCNILPALHWAVTRFLQEIPAVFLFSKQVPETMLCMPNRVSPSDREGSEQNMQLPLHLLYCLSLSCYFFSFPSLFPFFVQNEKQFVCAWREKERGTSTGIKWNLLQCLLDPNFLLFLLYLDRIQEEEKGRQETREDAGLIGINLGNVRKGHQQTWSVNSFIYT